MEKLPHSKGRRLGSGDNSLQKKISPYNVVRVQRIAQLEVRWLSVRQARVRISARVPREVFSSEQQAMKKWIDRGLGEWRWMNVIIMYGT
jgi:hypothetical protein